MPISHDEFRAALSKFASGVTIVTTKDMDGNLHGITVSAFCSVSLDPPLILVCIEKKAACHFAVGDSGAFVVNILSENHIDYSNRFALSIPDKFEGMDYREGVNGIPFLENVLAILECRLVNSQINGDHTIFVGQVENTVINENENPLLYFNGLYRKLGEVTD